MALGLSLAGLSGCFGDVACPEGTCPDDQPGGASGGGVGGTGLAEGPPSAGASLAGASSGGGGDQTGSGGGAGSGAGSGASGGGAGKGSDEPVSLSFEPRCASGELPLVQRRLLNRQFDHTVRDLLGVTSLDAHDGVVPSALLSADTPAPLSAEAEQAYRDVAEAIAQQVLRGPRRTLFLDCDPAEAECLRATILAFGRRAFRRPLPAAEALELEAALSADAPPDEQAKELLSLILSSPHFRDLELDGGLDRAADQVQLTSYELASRLSYFLWDSLPDGTLDAAADAGQLQTTDEVAAQVARMLSDPRLHDAVARFYESYLGVTPSSRWGKVAHEETSPGFTPEIQKLAQEELFAFFDHVAFSQGTFADLFLSNWGRVNRDLAPFYGLSAEDFGVVPDAVGLDPEQRPGFLTRLWFLSSFSHVQDSAPIVRGAFIDRFILGIDPGEPDPAAVLFPQPEGEFPTLREYIQELTSPLPCRACHHPFINPPGFALENYDQIGKWREVDPRGGAIDPVADVYVSELPVTVRSPLQFMQEIAGSALAQRKYLDVLVSDAFAQAFSPQQACVAEDLQPLLAQPDVPLLELWRAVATSEAFRRNWVTSAPLPE